MFLVSGGAHRLEHAFPGVDYTIDGTAASLHLLDSGVTDLSLTNGGLFVNSGSVNALTLDDGFLIGDRLTVASTMTINAVADQVVRLSNLTCFSGLTINGGAGNQEIVIDGLIMPAGRLLVTGGFTEFSITNATIGRVDSSTTYSSGGTVDFTDVTGFRFDGSILRAYRNAIRLEDCVAGLVNVHIQDPGVQADNTHDAVNLVGACGQLGIFGTMYGAVNQAANPRYGLAAAAGTTAPVDVFMSMAGYQTGAVNDASGNVVVH